MPEPTALLEAGNAALQAGNARAAAAHYRAAIAADPGFAEAHANLGLALQAGGDASAAEASLREALRLAPADGRIHVALADCLTAHGQALEAELRYTEGLLAAPENAAGWTNYGVLLAAQGHDAEAAHCHRQALALRPDYRLARFNLAYALLHPGQFEEGWACLEARPRPPLLDLPLPRWQGEALDGRAILIGGEAGQGDLIQFARYAAELKARGAARVGLCCHPTLTRLFATLAGADELQPLGVVPPPGWDCWAPAMSLPGLCHTTAATIPARSPYLAPLQEDVERWAARLESVPALRVGLVWRGNPNFENDAQRSLPGLATLASLGKLQGVRFISLQKGEGEDEAAQPPAELAGLLPWGSELRDFADTAALVAQLDLVIAVDTAVAHLAGALGRLCWVLLPAWRTDWRWQREREDSPWYPTLRLFRQRRAGDWGEVVERLTAALTARVQQS